MSFNDHFSGHAELYRAARPGYPDAPFAWLAPRAPGRALAWDAACGNGQATLALAPHFDRVVGTDPSTEQLALATAAPNVEYRAERAERSSLEDASVDLVTIAQALHWVDLDAFYAEVARVLRPGGVLAAIVYTGFDCDPAFDRVRDRLYADILGDYWPQDRRDVETGYRSYAFPFDELEVPHFVIDVDWTLDQVLGYLRSWSSSQRYLAANGVDPVTLVEHDLRAAWGEPSRTRVLSWNLNIRAGRLPA